jgi:hypothetical protein
MLDRLMLKINFIAIYSHLYPTVTTRTQMTHLDAVSKQRCLVCTLQLFLPLSVDCTEAEVLNATRSFR